MSTTTQDRPTTDGPLDPADYADVPRIADGLREFGDLAGYRDARLKGDLQKLIGNGQREVVNLPDSGKPQLGTRWLMILTPDQVADAQRRGLFNALLDGTDPDENTE